MCPESISQAVLSVEICALWSPLGMGSRDFRQSQVLHLEMVWGLKTIALWHSVGCDSGQVQTVSPSEIYANLNSICQEACRQLAVFVLMWNLDNNTSCPLGLSLNTCSNLLLSLFRFLHSIIFPHPFPSCPARYASHHPLFSCTRATIQLR